MNKDVFVVSTYPSDQKRLNVLKEVLQNLRTAKDFDIILSSNYKITDKDVLDLVDFYIYDFHDIKSYFDYVENDDDIFDGFFYSNSSFRVSSKFDNAYHFDIYRNVYLGASLAKSLNYEFFTYIEGDNIIGDKSKEHIRSLKKEMFDKNKNMIFLEGGKREDYKNMNNYVSTIFAGIPEYFVDNLKLPIWYEDWLKDSILNKNAFEIFFYLKFNHLSEKNFLTKPWNEFLDNMSDTKLNRLSKVDDNFLNNIFYYNDKEPGRLYSFFMNNTDKKLNIKIYNNESLFFNIDLDPGWYNVNSYEMEFFKNGNILLEINNGSDLKYDIKKLLNEKNLNLIKIRNKIEIY